MRKYNAMMWFTLAMVCVLLVYALTAVGLCATDKMIIVLAAAVVVCVWLVCESRVQRAYAPLVIRDELPEEKSIPPLREK